MNCIYIYIYMSYTWAFMQSAEHISLFLSSFLILVLCGRKRSLWSTRSPIETAWRVNMPAWWGNEPRLCISLSFVICICSLNYCINDWWSLHLKVNWLWLWTCFVSINWDQSYMIEIDRTIFRILYLHKCCLIPIYDKCLISVHHIDEKEICPEKYEEFFQSYVRHASLDEKIHWRLLGLSISRRQNFDRVYKRRRRRADKTNECYMTLWNWCKSVSGKNRRTKRRK